MSLIFRMLWLLAASFFKAPLPAVKPQNHLVLRVLPNDLDINLHMNNGRYLTICDLTRVDMFIRTGLIKLMMKRKWIPIITEHTMVYKKALKPFQKYQVEMAVTGWDERCFFMSHTFSVGDCIMAEGTSKGLFYHRREGVVPPEKVLETLTRGQK